MNLSRNFLILTIFSIMFTTLLSYEAHSDQNSDIKKEFKELRQMMEQMQQKIENLEVRNRVLEQQA